MSKLQPHPDSKLAESLMQSMQDNWGVFLAEGIILSVLGLGAIVVPLRAGLAATVFLGWLFLIAGLASLLFTFLARKVPVFRWSLLSALVALIAGTVLLWNPLHGLATLTDVLIAYFIIDGIVIIFFAIALRRELSGKWEWMMVNGVMDLILAGIIVFGFPATPIWALSLLVGIDLVYGGSTLIDIALAAHKTKFK